ncbi:hypothetical protein [Thiocystis violascens]|uniref:Uncharacterized protein n=1 Tax=Thiocystis violascens (strain ATCC 17096 / DSM 198 / 6111) TaxID=765911 RepID=I3YGW6_THIV6|nr:hypothetical protein [Thiocystis violascens]AFL76234.1 hypothetical protein Thivi_4432 [Thiocystis violascens DSM 198]
MTQYAHIDNPIPQKLPHEFQHAGGLTMGLDAMSDERLAELGWYPVRYEPLEPGALGYAPIELIGSEFVIASLPGDLAVAEQQRLEEMTCSKLQAKLAIAALGLVADFMAWKAALDPVTDFVTLAFLEDAQTWRRLDPTFVAAMTALRKTDAEADAFFELAVTL